MKAGEVRAEREAVLEGSPAPRYGVYVASLVAAALFLSSMDQSILPAVAASIQAEFGISDTQIGALVGAFTISLAISAIPIGYWADRWTRRTILGLGLTVWSLATLVTGLTRAFPQMLVTRAMLGIGEATAYPVGSSLISDYFSRRARGRAMAGVVMAVNIGVGVGGILGGVVGLRFGWRWAFYFAAGPGLLLALFAFTMREPLRGAAESQGPKLAVARDSGLRAFGRLLRIRSYAATVAAMVFSSMAIGSLQFVPLYVHREFGLNIAQAGAFLGVPLLLGALIGTPVVGWVVDRRGRSSTGAPVEVGLGGLLIAALAAVLMFSARSAGLFEAGMIVFAFVSVAALVAPFVVFQNVVAPSLRASAASLANTLQRLIGFTLGPLAVGFVSDLAHRDLRLSLLLLTPTGLVLATACLAAALATVKRDVAAMEMGWALRETSTETVVATVPSVAEPLQAAARP